MDTLSVATYKKSPKDLISQSSFSTKAGFCLFPRSRKLGRLSERRLFSKSPADGQKSLQSRRLAYRPTGNVLGFIFVFMFRRISVIPKLSAFLKLSCGILREVLYSFGIEALFIRQGRLKDLSAPADGFMLITFPDTPQSLTLMSSYG